MNVLVGATCRQHLFGLRPVPTCHGHARMADGEWPRAPKAKGSYLGRLPEGRGSKTGAEGTGAAGCTSRFLKPDGTRDGGRRVCDQSEAAGLTLRLLPPTRKHSLCRLRSRMLGAHLQRRPHEGGPGAILGSQMPSAASDEAYTILGTFPGQPRQDPNRVSSSISFRPTGRGRRDVLDLRSTIPTLRGEWQRGALAHSNQSGPWQRSATCLRPGLPGGLTSIPSRCQQVWQLPCWTQDETGTCQCFAHTPAPLFHTRKHSQMLQVPNHIPAKGWKPVHLHLSPRCVPISELPRLTWLGGEAREP